MVVTAPVGFLAGDQITAHGDERFAAFGPEYRHDVSRPPSPIEAGEYRLMNLKSIHKTYDVEGKHRLLAIPESLTGQKTRRPIAAQMRDDHSVSGRRK